MIFFKPVDRAGHVLTFSGMQSTIPTSEQDFPRELPLTLPPELWANLSPEQKAAYQTAQSIMTSFGKDRSLTLREVVSRSHSSMSDVLPAVQLLESMSLISMDSGTQTPMVTLRALPDEHVRFFDVIGQEQWLFVARPLDPPDVEPGYLN